MAACSLLTLGRGAATFLRSPRLRSFTMHSPIRPTALALGALLALAFAPESSAGPDKKTERLWKSKCASCHGEDGKGDTEKGKQMKTGDLTTAEAQKKTDEELRKVINEGFKEEKGGVKKEMDPYKEELKPEQVDALIAFIRGLKK
jgi:cytochrome c6